MGTVGKITEKSVQARIWLLEDLEGEKEVLQVYFLGALFLTSFFSLQASIPVAVHWLSL